MPSSPRAKAANLYVLMRIALAAAAFVAAALLFIYWVRNEPPRTPPTQVLEAMCERASTPDECRDTELFDRPTTDTGACIWVDNACRFLNQGAAA
jgi:hypothetical protein